MIEIHLVTTKESKDYLKSIATKFKNAFVKGIRQAALFAEAEAKKTFGKSGHLKLGTGHLRRSIVSSVEQRSKEISGIVSSNVEYAAIHEYGGVIKPKNGKYLTFRVGDRWANVTSVTIPARPYITPAIENNLDRIADIITDEISKEINK